MPNIVPPTGFGPLDDRATWQHMSTYVVGLGVSGTLPYKPDYATSNTGSFADIRALNKSWPVWPDPTINYSGNDALWNSPKSIDDFWHTAVNGRGKYFSATDPDSVVSGIQSALQAINASTGSSSANTISDQINITKTGLNFGSLYKTVEWVGDLRAFDSSDLSTVLWSAQQKLNAQTQNACDDRKIYVRDTSAVNKLGPFTLATKNCTTGAVSSDLNSALQGLLGGATSLSQYATMTTSPAAVDQKAQATVASLVNYLRGQRQSEGFAVGVSGKLYRSRTNVLGDIVNSKPQFVGAPYFEYADDGYYTFKSNNANRQNMIYVGANDGMLHAFYAPPSSADSIQLAKQGKEAWAYIPTKVISNLSRLADVGYASNHRFYVDGTPRVGDVKFADGTWHTILVGGLGAGGKGYYALDITNPESPRSLWELDDSNCARSGCSIGFTFGQPVIGKMADGTWAVFLTSGYNNSTGQAALFVVNAETGESIKTINAGTADATKPLGLTPISGWTERPNVDQTIARVYGGDLYGNMWRFNINDETTDSVYKIGVAKDTDGNVQPITMPPELGKVGVDAYAYYGTGRLIGSSDFANTQQQTVYAIRDSLSSTNVTTSLRSLLTPYVTTDDLSIKCVGTCGSVSSNGFLVDLAGSGEKVITPLALIGKTLVIISTQPQDNTCGSGGTSKAYFANSTNGLPVGPGYDFQTPVVGVIYLNSSDGSVIAQVKVPQASTGDSLQPTTTPTGSVKEVVVPTPNLPPGNTRASWREITAK
ncbi:pilus assembly protein [Rhodoferax aquaticus]|nr:PilC/PilY family type IV pilus protein [Rhodoferax aquaticus]